jgi:hypothetical protein
VSASIRTVRSVLDAGSESPRSVLPTGLVPPMPCPCLA